MAIPSNLCIRTTPYDLLPRELWRLIIERLPAVAAARLGEVCREFSELMRDPDIWRHFLERDFEVVVPKTPEADNLKQTFVRMRNISQGIYTVETYIQMRYRTDLSAANMVGSTEIRGHWSGDIEICHHQQSSSFKSVQTEGKTVSSIIPLGADSFLAATSNAIECRYLKDLQLRGILAQPLKAPIESLEQAPDGLIYVVYRNNTIDVFDPQTLECTATLRPTTRTGEPLPVGDYPMCHEGAIVARLIWSKDEPGAIEVWSPKDDCLKGVLKGHTERPFAAFQTKSGHLCTLSEQGVRLWNLTDCTCCGTFQLPSETERIYNWHREKSLGLLCIQTADENRPGEIYILSPSLKEIVNTPSPSLKLFMPLKTPPGDVLSMSEGRLFTMNRGSIEAMIDFNVSREEALLNLAHTLTNRHPSLEHAFTALIKHFLSLSHHVQQEVHDELCVLRGDGECPRLEEVLLPLLETQADFEIDSICIEYGLALFRRALRKIAARFFEDDSLDLKEMQYFSKLPPEFSNRIYQKLCTTQQCTQSEGERAFRSATNKERANAIIEFLSEKVDLPSWKR